MEPSDLLSSDPQLIQSFKGYLSEPEILIFNCEVAYQVDNSFKIQIKVLNRKQFLCLTFFYVFNLFPRQNDHNAKDFQKIYIFVQKHKDDKFEPRNIELTKLQQNLYYTV